MKKLLITCLYLTLTLAVCAAGFFLPSTLNDYQDRQIFAKIEHTAMEPPELAYSSSLYDTLRLLSREHYFVEYPSAASKRSSKEIYTIALDLIEQFKKNNILPDLDDAVSNYTTSLQLAIISDGIQNTDSNISEESAIAADEKKSLSEYSEAAALDITTAVVWNCSIYYQNEYWLSISIDDKSGKIVSFSMCTNQISMLTVYGDEEAFDVFAASVAEFCEDYYKLPSTSLQQSIIRSYNTIFDKSSGILEAYYTIQMKEENGQTIQMPLRIYPDYMILN